MSGDAAASDTGAPPLRVAVVGAGIGGLTAALALIRAGIDATVYEQTDPLTELGAQFSIGPNATRLLGALDLLEPLRAIGVRPDAVEHLRWDDGRVLIRTPLGAGAEAFFGAPQLDFLRTDLQRALAAALPARALRTGARVERIDQDEARRRAGARRRRAGTRRRRSRRGRHPLGTAPGARRAPTRRCSRGPSSTAA